MTSFEYGLRLSLVVIAGLLIFPMAAAGVVLGNTRRIGCYSLASFAAGTFIGNATHMHSPVTWATPFFAAGVVFGWFYLAHLIATPEWRARRGQTQEGQ
mgnify:FL=1